MSAHRKDEKWLDDQLQRAVNGAAPAFDAQAWKQKYAREYETLVGRGKQMVGWGLPHHNRRDQRDRWGKPHPTESVLRGLFGKVAIAAAILIAAAVLLSGRFVGRPDEPIPVSPVVVHQSPAQMVSMISLSAAFRRGGIDELDKQCDRALEKLGPRPNRVSMQELFREMNGKG